MRGPVCSYVDGLRPGHCCEGTARARVLSSLLHLQSYFAMAHGQGRVWNIEDKTAYEVYWARYADWTITTPLLLTHLILFAGLAWQQWMFVLLSDVGMIVTGLIGNLITDPSKWAWVRSRAMLCGC